MSGERGTASIMIVGFAVVAIMMVGVVVDASAAYLRRSGLDSLADGAALAAADGVQGRQVYEGGLGERAEIDAGGRPRVRRGLPARDRRRPSLPGARLPTSRPGPTGSSCTSRTARPADHPAGVGAPADDLRDRRVLRRGQRLTPRRDVRARTSEPVVQFAYSDGIGAGQSLATDGPVGANHVRTDEREVRLLCRAPAECLTQ